MTVTLSAMHEQLRRDTARMLGYDYAKVTAAESVRLDRAAMLRLELDDCQTKKLNGQPFDMNKYVAASEALERMLSPDGTGTDVDFEARYQARVQAEFAGAGEKVAQLISAQIERLAAYNAHHPDQARLKFERELQAAIDKYPKDEIIPKPTVEWVRDGTHCFFSEGFDPNAEGRRHGFDGWVRGVDDASSALPDRAAARSESRRENELGPYQTSGRRRGMSAIGGKADIEI
jgi:hypothetical protein